MGPFALVAGPPVLLCAGAEDGCDLVLWSLSPGFRGGATYEISGDAVIVAEGREAQGIAGYMGSAPCPVLLVSGDCELRWHRSGRLYATAADWVARRVDGQWTVASAEDTTLADALGAP